MGNANSANSLPKQGKDKGNGYVKYNWQWQ